LIGSILAIQHLDSTAQKVGSGEMAQGSSCVGRTRNPMFYNDEILFLSVELKYCERCGGLHVRRSNSEAKFCLSCIEAEQMVVQQVLLKNSKRSRMRSWLESVSAILVAAQPPANTPEMNGGAQ
jgi:hypothetical protein